MNEPTFNIGNSVYLRTDIDQKEYLVTGVLYRQNVIIYCISCGGSEVWAYDFELSF